MVIIESINTLLNAAVIAPSKISELSSGEFVGMVADDTENKIDLKAFHCEIINDHAALKKETDYCKEIPVVRKMDNRIIQRNYLQVRQDIIQSEMERILNDPGVRHLVVKKERLHYAKKYILSHFFYIICQ